MNHTKVLRLAVVFEVVSIVIRQYMPFRTTCGRCFWIRKESDHVGVAVPASIL